MQTSKEVLHNIQYTCYSQKSNHYIKKSIQVYGIDTEAYDDGKCFMIATSEGDVYDMKDFPRCLQNRKYRGKNFVAYNLKYDMGALLQHLPIDVLETLRSAGSVEYEGNKYRVIANKMLSIRRSNHSITIYDMLNFYCMSLEKAASMFLGEHKLDMETKTFTREYVKQNYDMIAKYCIQDAVLVKKLADILIKKFEDFGVYPRKLYSVAYISYQYFRTKTKYVTVKRYWNNYKDVLAYALAAYNGGKFEVTRKGIDYYYEYDISSAYPHEISNLVDITNARVVYSKKYRKHATYAFLNCKMNIPLQVHSPIAIKRGTVNTYPTGDIEKVITKKEYEYLIEQGVDISIIDGYFLHIDNKKYPYRKEVNTLYRKKQEYKKLQKDMEYHIVKIFLNSLYGKMVQMIQTPTGIKCSSCWNIIYGAIITANCRVLVTRMQQMYPSVVAVHTDSIISTKPLSVCTSTGIGSWDYETEGNGVIIGSGVYQIGKTSKIRGFPSEKPLLELIHCNSTKRKINNVRPYTWREVAFRGMDISYINKFEDIPRFLTVNFDTKRLWIDDWKTFTDIEKRQVESVPLIYSSLFF